MSNLTQADIEANNTKLSIEEEILAVQKEILETLKKQQKEGNK